MNQSQAEAQKYIAKMGLDDTPTTIEELAAVIKKWVAHNAVYEETEQWHNHEIDLSTVAAFGFEAVTGISVEEDLIMDYTIKATSLEISIYMDELLQRIMATKFLVAWPEGYADAEPRTDSFLEIIGGGSYNFESEELVELLACKAIGDTWTHRDLSGTVVFVRVA